MKFALNHPVTTSDGVELELGDVVVDPRLRAVTHAAIQPARRHEEARLVPAGLLHARAGAEGLELACTAAELQAYPLVAEISVIDPEHRLESGEGWTVGTTDVVPLPVADPMLGTGWVDDQITIRWDRIPDDEVELRHSSAIYSADDHRLGSVDGLVCDEAGRITHLVIKKGILFTRRDVLVPVSGVQRFENDVITLTLTKHQVGELEAQPLDDWLDEQHPSPA